MIEAGDIYLADLNEDRRLRVLVVSNERFHRMAGRALVAPELAAVMGAPTFPWRVNVDETTFAVDLLRSVPVDRLLDRVDRAPAGLVKLVEQSLRRIT